MKRTKAEQAADDRDSVKSNLQALGAGGALRYSAKQLSGNPEHHVRRMCILTIRAAAKQLREEINSATRLAHCHASGLRRIGIKVALLLAVAVPASAQQAVWTNVVNGRRQAEIVRETRPYAPAAPVPASIVDTPVLPRNWRPPLGPGSYVPPPRAVASQAPSRPPQPWFINGIYVGPSPSGNWMSTSIGRPIVDVHIVSTPRRPR
jgi:hypothetical protein